MSASTPGRPLLFAATAVVALALAAGLWVLGSPSAQRDRRMDERRQEHLAAISRHVDLHHATYEQLPPDLATVAATPGLRLAIVDPVDGTPYEYEVTGDERYRLCARFATDTADQGAGPASAAYGHWPHGAGRTCFDRVAAPRIPE